MAAQGGELPGELRSALPAGVCLRQRRDEDLSFLCRLYAQTREEELRPVDWPEQQKQDFLRDQFDKQHSHYLKHYPRANWWVVTRNGDSIGRLYVDETAAELRLMDISLLEHERNRGLGSAMMRGLLRHADRKGLAATLHVEPFNPALRLYRRLGFEKVETRGVYEFMRRAPGAGSVEDDFIAGARGVAANGHQEQVEPSVDGVK